MSAGLLPANSEGNFYEFLLLLEFFFILTKKA